MRTNATYQSIMDDEIELETLRDDILDVVTHDEYSFIPTTDNPWTPSLTSRVILLGSFWCVFLAITNSILSFRTNRFEIPSFLATLLSYPMGIMLATTMPKKDVNFIGVKFSLNPGPFSPKEHVLITIIASAGGKLAYGIDNVVAQKSTMFMSNTKITFMESFMWVLVTQLIGFGLAGLCRRFLIKPKEMIWPNILSQVALFAGFHSNSINDFKGLSRYSFFWIALLVCFCYTWIPQFFMVMLQSFTPLCFLPFNQFAKFLFSSDNSFGLGIGTLTLDWYFIKGDALTSPFWATLNSQFGNIFFGWILTPILFLIKAYGNDQTLTIRTFKDGSAMPVLNSAAIFNSSGNLISAVSLYDKTSYDLNFEEYKRQAPISITTSFALSYALSFLSIMSAFTHVFLWYGSDIKRQLVSAWKRVDDKIDSQDIHNILMQNYPDVPDWTFLVFLISLILLQILISLFTEFKIPLWGILLCISISAISILPIGIINAISGQRLGINVLSEFVIGYLVPGKTVTVMAFKSLGTNSIIQSITLLSDLKLGHYMKISPRHILFSQLYGSIVGAFVNTITTFWVMDNLQNILGNGEWRATDYFVFYNAGAIWGAIGPARFFGGQYSTTLHCFWIGLTLPFIPWILYKITRNESWRFINVPLLSSFFGPGGYQNGYLMPLAVAYYFQHYTKKYHFKWWDKYNYILAIALDSGVGLAVLSITAIQQFGFVSPKFSLNPDIENGIPIDYYCIQDNYI